jgi:thiamine-phosphate pyrophosphorylase
MFDLYLVTDEKACLGRNLIDIVKQAVEGGVTIVQLREKELH